MNQDTIVAIATAAGQGALGIIRLSGERAIEIIDELFKGKKLQNAEGHSLHFGRLMKGEETLDEVLVSVFRAPRSFTREDVVEISCHGSRYILREALALFVQKGARLALAGEFTQRAFLNGAMDLAQAEAVADLIASGSASAHRMAMQQMRGGVSDELKILREKLLNFTSLIELELDFGEEDVEFANRDQLKKLVHEIIAKSDSLIDSFALGNALKEGVPTVILGKPNAGKSTLLNALLKEDRAIVSEIPGTTRDVIEDRLLISGIEFRLMDTAGLRETQDSIEAEGVSRAVKLAESASLILYIFDLQTESPQAAESHLKSLKLPDSAHVLKIGNKTDLLATPQKEGENLILLSAKGRDGLDSLRQQMVESVYDFSQQTATDILISNTRHLHALKEARANLALVIAAMEQELSSDLLTIDIRAAIYHIGEITGAISNDEVLGNIFGKFCIGK